jgi:hypothetical protein
MTQQHSGDLGNTAKTGYKWTMRFHLKSARSFFLLGLLVIPAALAQGSQPKATALRPVTRHEGLAIVHAALHSRRHEADCSHLVHALYERAGFPYDYAPSSDLYEGIDGFRRVAHPQPGDLAVWVGHAGIVVNSAEHSFFSMLSSGPGVDFWDSAYWKQRGRPHFFRYLKQPASSPSSGSIRNATLKP